MASAPPVDVKTCTPADQTNPTTEETSPKASMTDARIIRSGADQGNPLTLDKEEFLNLMERVSPEEAAKIEQILFGRDIANTRTGRMQAFRTVFFGGYDLSPLSTTRLGKSDLGLIYEYTSSALNKNRFEFIPGSSIKDSNNQDLFSCNMVAAGGLLALCVGHNQDDPGIKGVEVIRLPEPTKTKDGLKYIPGEALGGKQCIVHVPEPWFGAGSQHKGFYPHDYSVTLNMLLELADKGDTKFMPMVRSSFANFKALSETIGHIPNANKSWSIGDTSRTQTNTLASQVLLYAKYLENADTGGKKVARNWLKKTGEPIARNNLAFLTAKRAQTPQGLYRFVPIGKTPDSPGGDTYVYTSEMHNSPVLHNFYFERTLDDLVRTYEERTTQVNYCTENDCQKYIEEVTDAKIIGRLKPRNMAKLIEDRKDLQGLSKEAVKARLALAEKMDDRTFVWDHRVRGEEIVVQSEKTGKYYRLTNYAIGSDQAMRASGFDPSDMAGLNSLDALDTAYAGHNSQLYRQISDMAQIQRMLGRPQTARKLDEKAAKLKESILDYMWSAKHGELVPVHQEKGPVDYRFFDGSYALWAHLFDVNKPLERSKLMSIVRNIADYEGPEGPYASTDWSGHNWGWGKVWPVMAAYSFMGLRDYSKKLRENNFPEEARLCDETAQRIGLKWLYSNAEMFAKQYGFGENLAMREDGKPLENAYGYNIDPKKAGNYTWHVAITRWLYPQLNEKSKAAFDTFYAALKAKHPDRL